MSGVLLVMLDDARADLLRYMPYASGAFRAAGTEFTNMRCNVPACDPARAGLLTGQWARGAANGVYQNDGSDITAPTVDSLPVWLGTAGVTTGLFGKYIQSTGTVWDERRIVSGYDAYGYTVDDNGTPTTPAAHQLTYTATELAAFIAAQAGDWFAWWAPTNPHINLTWLSCNPLPATVPKFRWKRWVFTLLTDTTDKPSWIAALPQFTQPQLAAIREVARQQIRECYDVDQALATIGAAIDFDTTTVIVCSDSGVFYAEQRLGNEYGSTKDHPYDVVAKVPCVIRGPGVLSGRTNTAPTTLQDITATVCDILGATPTVTQDGTSLLDLMVTPDPTRATLYERQGDATYPDGEGAVTETMKLMHWPGEVGTDEWEAYDLDTDPDELVNWANDAGRAADLAAMQAVLAGL